MRQKKERDTGGGANWMDTYGDLVTLLFAFFVLLYAFSSVDQVKWEKLVEVFTGSPPAAIMEPIDPSLPIEGLSIDDILPAVYMTKIQRDTSDQQADVSQQGVDEPGLSDEEIKQVHESMLELTNELNGYVDDNSLQGKILVNEEADIVYITMQEGTFFGSAQAEIKAEGQAHLQNIGDIIKRHMDEVQVIVAIGHTDNRPISNFKYKDNFDLSNMRAANTIRYISENCDIELKNFKSWGSGEWDPIDTNDTEEGRARNRRVELQIISSIGELKL